MKLKKLKNNKKKLLNDVEILISSEINDKLK